MKKSFEMFPLGVIRKEDGSAFLVVFEEFMDGLLGMDHFSHVILFCWFEDSDTPEKRKTLRVHPRNDKTNPLTGVFATRSPRRPNPIAIYISAIHGIHENRIEIDPIDAFDGTPVIDLKPYIPLTDSISDARVASWTKAKVKEGSRKAAKPRK